MNSIFGGEKNIENNKYELRRHYLSVRYSLVHMHYVISKVGCVSVPLKVYYGTLESSAIESH